MPARTPTTDRAASVSARREPAPWLHSRKVLAGTAMLTAAVLLLALAFVGLEQRDLQASTQAHNSLFAGVLEDQANRALSGVEEALGSATEAVRLLRSSGAGASNSADPVPLSAVLQQSIQTLPSLRSLSLVDPQGRVLASSNPGNVGRLINRQRLLGPSHRPGLGPLLPGRDLAELEAAARAGPSGAAVLTLLPLVRALPAVVAARPPHSTNTNTNTSASTSNTNPATNPATNPPSSAQATDWLVAALNPEYFVNQYDLLLSNTAQRAALLSSGGQLLAASQGVRRATGQQLQGYRLFTELLPRQAQGAFIGPGLDGDEAYSAYRSARRQPLVLVVETPAATVSAQLRSTALKVAGATAGLLAIVGALATLVWRSLRSREAVSGDLAAARGNLAAKDAFTDRLFEVSPIPMVVKDTAGRFVRVNKAWTDLTGLSTERVIGANLGRLYPPQLAAPHEVQEQMAIISGQPVNYEEQLLDSDGLPRDVMIRVMPFTDAGGQVTGVISCLTDVTEFREAAQRTLEAKNAAEHANSTKSEFLANISHELRTPLQSILGFSELGGSRSRTDQRLHSMFGDIHGAGQRMLTLVNNLLDLTRLESTVGEIHLAPMALAPAMRSVVQELRQMALARKLALVAPLVDAEREAAPGTGLAGLWAMADAFRLQQVLRNVLANAIRFAPAGSDIAVTWGHDGLGGLFVRVRDHGPGIPVGELEAVFESFVQSSRTKDGSGGTGLGLAICRKIMAAHHGHISARNLPEGGAVFEFSLPAVVAVAELTPEDAAQPSKPPASASLK